MKLTLADTGAKATIKIPVPVHDKKAGWILKPKPIAVHDDADATKAFIDEIVESWTRHHDEWLGRQSLPASGRDTTVKKKKKGEEGDYSPHLSPLDYRSRPTYRDA